MSQTDTAYIGNIEYLTQQAATSKFISLLRVHNAEGYTEKFYRSNVSQVYFYYRRDHLGNNREVWRAPYTVYVANNHVSPGYVVQQTQYYPSGLTWDEGTGASQQPFKYNGKEFVEMHGYDAYDYGARGYYPALGRFTTIDPLAESIIALARMHIVHGIPPNRI